MNKTKTQETLSKQWVEAPQSTPRIPYETGLAAETPTARARRWLEKDWDYHIGGKEPTPEMLARAQRAEAQRARINTWHDNGSDMHIDHSTGTIKGLKLLELVNGRVFSTYATPGGAAMEYHLGQTYCEQVRHNHGGGYYLYLTRNIEHFMNAFWQNVIINLDAVRWGEFALVECEAEGPYIYYDTHGRMITINQASRAKKVAASRLVVANIAHTFVR